jgi:hypothetical protein
MRQDMREINVSDEMISYRRKWKRKTDLADPKLIATEAEW